METGVLQQISADDFRGYDLMADVFGNHHEGRGNDDQNRLQTELGEQKIREGEPGGLGDVGEVHDAHRESQTVTDDDGDQYGDGRRKAAEQNLSEDRHRKSHQKDSGELRVYAEIFGTVRGNDSAVLGSVLRQLQTDQRHNRTHGGGGKDDVDPAYADEFDDNRDGDENQSGYNKPAQGILVSKLRIVNDQQSGRDKGETRAEVCGGFPLCDKNKDKCANAVHQQCDGRTYPE